MEEFDKKGTFKNEDGTDAFKSEKDRKRKYGPNVMLPKAPKTSFMFFHHQKFPTLFIKGVTEITEVSNKIGEMWRGLSDK